jgi:hypothetical protein
MLAHAARVAYRLGRVSPLYLLEPSGAGRLRDPLVRISISVRPACKVGLNVSGESRELDSAKDQAPLPLLSNKQM